MAYKYKTTYEMCPHCEQEVRIKNIFEIQDCPKCKCPILPCSICDATNENVPSPKCSCDKCPLDTPEYKERLVNRAMSILYGDDEPKNDDSNRAHLQSLTNIEISILISKKWDYDDDMW